MKSITLPEHLIEEIQGYCEAWDTYMSMNDPTVFENDAYRIFKSILKRIK